MVNQVVLVGRITRDIELKVTSTNKEVVSFTLAVNRNFKNQNGQYDADFINCVAFGQPARFMDNYLSKGRLISVVGRINTRSYENQQNQRVYVTEVIAEQISPLDSASSSNNQVVNNPQPNMTNDYQPTTNQVNNEASPYDFMDFNEIDENDLPF